MHRSTFVAMQGKDIVNDNPSYHVDIKGIDRALRRIARAIAKNDGKVPASRYALLAQVVPDFATNMRLAAGLRRRGWIDDEHYASALECAYDNQVRFIATSWSLAIEQGTIRHSTKAEGALAFFAEARGDASASTAPWRVEPGADQARASIGD